MARTVFKNWVVYQKSFALAQDIFRISKRFPKEERYSLTDQVRRSSRSVCANLAEASAKRCYPKHFYAKLTDCAGEIAETQVWIDFARSSQYINDPIHVELSTAATEIGKLLSYMMRHPQQFGVRPFPIQK